MEFEVKIDGFNIAPFIAKGGFKWQRSDVDASDAGMDLDGHLRRNRIRTRRRLDISCIPVNSETASKILTAIMPEWVSVYYYDVQEGKYATRRMYSNNNPASFELKKRNGDILWGGIAFPLIEE